MSELKTRTGECGGACGGSDDFLEQYGIGTTGESQLPLLS